MYSAANKVHRDPPSGKESEVPQPLELLELVALDISQDRILRNGDIRLVMKGDVSQIAGNNKMGGLFRATSKNAPTSGKKKKVLGRNEFRQARNKSVEDRDNADNNMENQLAVITKMIIANSKKKESNYRD